MPDHEDNQQPTVPPTVVLRTVEDGRPTWPWQDALAAAWIAARTLWVLLAIALSGSVGRHLSASDCLFVAAAVTGMGASVACAAMIRTRQPWWRRAVLTEEGLMLLGCCAFLVADAARLAAMSQVGPDGEPGTRAALHILEGALPCAAVAFGFPALLLLWPRKPKPAPPHPAPS